MHGWKGQYCFKRKRVKEVEDCSKGNSRSRAHSCGNMAYGYVCRITLLLFRKRGATGRVWERKYPSWPPPLLEVIRQQEVFSQNLFWQELLAVFCHATASTALKRLNGFSGKNHFYRANRDLGRIIRTEYTLDFMSDPDMRKRNRRGLLKGEQIHALARDLKYGHRGRLNNRDWLKQKNSCSCLTLVIACIIYWQAKEIRRVIKTHTPPKHMDLALLSNISPVSWENIILYGDYILNRNKVIR